MSISLSRSRTALLLAGILGLTGVALGALGAHAVRSTLLERGTLIAWETGARYHMMHAIAVFAAALWLRNTNGGGQAWALWAARLWSVGILLFSGSLYWLALGGPRWLGPVTPLGGILLLTGWGAVLAAAFVKDESGREVR